MTEIKPKPPAGLAAFGRAYWRSVMGKYEELNVVEVVLLRQTCKLLDSIAAYDAKIEEDGLVVEGSANREAIRWCRSVGPTSVCSPR